MPTPSRRAVVWVGLTCGIVVPVAAARADEPTVPVRIEFRGTEGCFDGAQFQGELAARDPRVRPAGPGERAPLLVVTVTRGVRQPVHGRLVIEDTDGAVSRRDVDGDGCESVLGALALMAAIAVDPTAPLTGSQVPPTPSKRRDSDSGTAPTDQASVSVGGAGHAGNSHLALMAGAGVSTGVAPTPVWMIPLSAEVDLGRENAVWGVLRPGFLHADSGSDAAIGGDARFVLNAGTLDLCASFPATRSMRLLPCLHSEGGALGAAGSNIKPARSETTPWVGLGAVGAVRYLVFSPVFVELSFGVRFPLVRDRFFFEPDTTIFRPPVAAIFGAGCVGVAFL